MQPGQRQVNLFDLEQVDLLAEAAQADQFLFGEGQGRRHAERPPLLSVELHIGARLAKPRHGVSVAGMSAGPTAGLAKSAPLDRLAPVTAAPDARTSASVMSAPLAEVDPDIAELLGKELGRQRDTLEMIASENFVPRSVLQAQGSVLTNKYAEGLPGRRYYGGCEHVDVVENIARDRAKALFGADFANVQPHSGAHGQRRGAARADVAGRAAAGSGPRQRRSPDPRHAAELLWQVVRRPASTASTRRRIWSTWTRCGPRRSSSARR